LNILVFIFPQMEYNGWSFKPCFVIASLFKQPQD